MASSEYADFQKFKDKDGTPLVSLQSHPYAADTGERYVLWTDIQHTFRGIDHLETTDKERVLFQVDTNDELWQPLRIQYDPGDTLIVIYRDNQKEHIDTSANIPVEDNDLEQRDSQNPELNEIRRHLKGLLDTCKYLYQYLKTVTDGSRKIFRQAVANARYYNLILVEEIKRLDDMGNNALVDGKDRKQLLEELHDLEQQVPDWGFQRICRTMLCHKSNSWSYATSSIFLVLPTSLDCWDDSDTSTHQFRLYFMCDNWKQESALKDMPQHVHLSNHPGYVLKRQQEFFQTYGDYVLRILLMIKSGHLNSYYEIPPLDALNILWNCDPGVIGSHISKDNIGSLVDKAISYLQRLSPPKWTRHLDLDRDQSLAIKTFLDLQDGDQAEGNLHRYIDSTQLVFWMCQTHVYQYFDYEKLEALKEFVQKHGGRVDIQQAKIEVQLGSPTEAERFRTLVKGCGWRFDTSVKLTWNATWRSVNDLCTDIADKGGAVLELDGITLDIESQGYDRSLPSLFDSSASASTHLWFVTLLNYPRPQKRSILLGEFLLESVDYSACSPHSWVDIRSDLSDFGRVVSRAKDPSDWKNAAIFLQSMLETHSITRTNAVIMYRDNWSATFDAESGTVVKVKSQDTASLEHILSTGTITSLGVQVNSLQFDNDFFHMVRINSLLQELEVSYLGYNALDYAGQIFKMWHSSAGPCVFTLLDRIEGTNGRIVAELVIRESDSKCPGDSVLDVHECDIDPPISKRHASNTSMDPLLMQWDCDHVFSSLSDYSSSFLDMATKQHPLALTMFTLDVSQLSQVGLSSIQEVFSRSNVERLHVVCTPVESLSTSISQVLGSVQWNTLKSLILSGYKIEEWCQIWPLPLNPQLLSLQIEGSLSAVQDLSHSSVLFVQHLIFACPLMELRLRNMNLQDTRDWVLLVDSMDLSSLQTLDLSENGAMPFLSVPDAADLFGSKLKATHSETESPKLVLPLFTLDATTLSQPDLMRIQRILSHYIIKKLIINCDPIGPNISDHAARLLESVHWSLLEHLRLSGDNINQWIRILANVETPRLKTLHLRGTETVQQELSHTSVLFVGRLIGTCSLAVLYFKGLLLQDQRDWLYLVDKMDPSMLDGFNLSGESYEQFMSTPDAVDLEYSKRTGLKAEQRGVVEE